MADAEICRKVGSLMSRQIDMPYHRLLSSRARAVRLASCGGTLLFECVGVTQSIESEANASAVFNRHLAARPKLHKDGAQM